MCAPLGLGLFAKIINGPHYPPVVVPHINAGLGKSVVGSHFLFGGGPLVPMAGGMYLAVTATGASATATTNTPYLLGHL